MNRITLKKRHNLWHVQLNNVERGMFSDFSKASTLAFNLAHNITTSGGQAEIVKYDPATKQQKFVEVK